MSLLLANMQENETTEQKSVNSMGCLLTPAILTIIFIITVYGILIVWIPLIWLILRFITYKKNEVILTNKRVVGKTGLINTTQMDSPLNMITSVAVNSGLMGKLIGYGTLQITTASTIYKFKFMSNADILQQAIINQMQIFEDEKISKQAKAIANASNI